MLNSNGLTDIQPYAFNGTRLEEVYLYRNVDLVRLDERTFSGVISGPTLLDVSESRVNSLPTMGLEAVQKLKAKNTWALKKLPPLRAFQHLQSAELTYPSHCCGLSKVKRRRGVDKAKDLSLMLHAADISHPAKDWPLHYRWTQTLMEFFRQTNPGFIDFILELMFSALIDSTVKAISPLIEEAVKSGASGVRMSSMTGTDAETVMESVQRHI
eukprot:XP_014006852.1 PREDICTED: thyrotropin receptor-like [Salmo salar]